MKAPLKARRPSPEEALAIATSTAPQQPPAQIVRPPVPAQAPANGAGEGASVASMAAVSGVPPPDPATTLNLRVRMSTIDAIMAAAKERGLTMKQVVSHALRDAGVGVAEADLEDRTPRRK
jgi:hypothetical protein